MKKILIGFFLTGLLMSSCADDDISPVDDEVIQAPSIQSTQDNVVMRTSFDEINSIVQVVVENTLAETEEELDPCYSVDWNEIDQEITITFDSTLCIDGRIRDGEIVINYTGPYRTEGSVITTTLNEYSVNGERIEGTHVVTNNGDNEEGNLEFDVQVVDGSRTLLDGRLITWESERTRTWIEGESTQFNVLDDVYEIKGIANGVNRNEVPFAMEIDSDHPLIIDIDCISTTGLPSGGIISITPEGDFPRTVDYGDGTCNTERMITVSYRGFDFPVTITSPLSSL